MIFKYMCISCSLSGDAATLARKQREWLSANGSGGQKKAEQREEAQMDSEIHVPNELEITKKGNTEIARYMYICSSNLRICAIWKLYCVFSESRDRNEISRLRCHWTQS